MTRPASRSTPATRSGGCWRPSPCPPTRSRPARKPRPGCTAACWPASKCSSCWTTPATPPRSGRCCPARPGSMVLVTSRSQLTGLAAADGASLVSLDVLGGDEARVLLARRLGSDRIAAEPAAVSDLVQALRAAAAGPQHRRRASRRPARPAARRAGRRPARPAGAAGRPGHRGPGQQRPDRVLLVLPAAWTPPAGADVPAAGPAPRPRYHRGRGRQPGRDPRWPGRPGAARPGRRAPDRRARPGPVRLP